LLAHPPTSLFPSSSSLGARPAQVP
jgi:hypothetical protein